MIKWGQWELTFRQLDPVAVLMEPLFSLWLQVVARSVVDNEEDLLPGVSYEVFQEYQEGRAVEHLGELESKSRFVFKRDHSQNVGRLSLTECVDMWLLADASPSLMSSQKLASSSNITTPPHLRAFFLSLVAFFEATLPGPLYPLSRGACEVAARKSPSGGAGEAHDDCDTLRRIAPR